MGFLLTYTPKKFAALSPSTLFTDCSGSRARALRVLTIGSMKPSAWGKSEPIKYLSSLVSSIIYGKSRSVGSAEIQMLRVKYSLAGRFIDTVTSSTLARCNDRTVIISLVPFGFLPILHSDYHRI